jgi:hypothetical protein
MVDALLFTLRFPDETDHGGRLRVIATGEDAVAVRQILAAHRVAQPLGPGAPGGARHGRLTSPD